MMDSSTAAFLGMSCISTGWQMWMFRQLLHVTDTVRDTPAYSGLIRTSICRIFAAVLYVAVGINAAVIGFAPLQVAFVVFAGVQAMWCANSLADVQVKRQMSAVIGRHRATSS